MKPFFSMSRLCELNPHCCKSSKEYDDIFVVKEIQFYSH